MIICKPKIWILLSVTIVACNSNDTQENADFSQQSITREPIAVIDTIQKPILKDSIISAKPSTITQESMSQLFKEQSCVFNFKDEQISLVLDSIDCYWGNNTDCISPKWLLYINDSLQHEVSSDRGYSFLKKDTKYPFVINYYDEKYAIILERYIGEPEGHFLDAILIENMQFKDFIENVHDDSYDNYERYLSSTLAI